MKKLIKRKFSEKNTVQKFSCLCAVRCQCLKPEWGWQTWSENYNSQVEAGINKDDTVSRFDI